MQPPGTRAPGQKPDGGGREAPPGKGREAPLAIAIATGARSAPVLLLLLLLLLTQPATTNESTEHTNCTMVIFYFPATNRGTREACGYIMNARLQVIAYVVRRASCH